MSDQYPKILHDRLDEFRELVLRDPELQIQLRGITERHVFIERLRQLGAQHGYHFSAEQIEAALAEARRDWNRRRSVR
jgi:hypothetical protein